MKFRNVRSSFLIILSRCSLFQIYLSSPVVVFVVAMLVLVSAAVVLFSPVADPIELGLGMLAVVVVAIVWQAMLARTGVGV